VSPHLRKCIIANGKGEISLQEGNHLWLLLLPPPLKSFIKPHRFLFTNRLINPPEFPAKSPPIQQTPISLLKPSLPINTKPSKTKALYWALFIVAEMEQKLRESFNNTGINYNQPMFFLEA